MTCLGDKCVSVFISDLASVQWESSCCMRKDGQRDGRTDITKLLCSFRNIANARNSCCRPVG